jgi:hypothetical protein
LDGFTPEGYLGCVLHVRVFRTFAKRLYICGWAVGQLSLLVKVLSFVCERDLVRVERGREEGLFDLSFLQL